MRKGAEVRLGPGDRERLEAVIGSGNSPQKHVWRARIVLLSAAGVGMMAIQRQTGKGKPTIWRWQARFMAEGVDGLLHEATRPAGKPPLSPQTIERVVEMTLAEPPGETTHWTGRAMAKAGPAEQNRVLCSNKVDAIIFVAENPDGLTQEATTGCRARLVRVAGPAIDRLLAAHPYYTTAMIPGGMYPGNPEDVPTIGTQAVLVTSSDQPDALPYGVVKAVFANFDVFRRLHPALSTLKIKDMVPSQSVMPIHPGALNYYREAGLVHR
jgi:transposase